MIQFLPLLLSSKKHALPVAVGVAILGAFALGYCQRDHEADAERVQVENEILRQTVENEQRIAQTKADMQAAAMEAGRQTYDQAKQIQARYEQLVAAGDEQSDGVRTPAASSSGDLQVPQHAGAASGPCRPCTCQCDRQVTARIRRELLAITRDCDILAANYNQLLQLWSTTKQRQEAQSNQRNEKHQ